MKFKKFTSLLLVTSIVGSLTSPVFADEEIMVLPPLNDQSSQLIPDQQPATEADNSSFLKGTITTVPVGSSFEIITNSEISTETTRVGEIFTTTLSQPVTVGNNIVIPAGSEAYGQVTYSEDAGRVGRNAVMEIKFTSIKDPNGKKIPMMGKIVTKDGTGMLKGGSIKSQLVKSAAAVAIPATAGVFTGMGIGAIAGETGVGAAVGSSVGGLFGIGYMVYRKGKEVELPRGTKMIITLEQPLTVGQ